MNKPQTFVDRLWQDKNGKPAIMERPNIPLVGWFVFALANTLATGRLEIASEYLAFGFLFTWAWLEFYSGRSYIRRILGVVVLIILICNKVN